MPNYQNGKIYKLVCSETGKIYIGSTVQKLIKRKWGHTDNRKKLCMSKDFIKPEIYLIENYPCNSKQELCKRERHYVETIDCVNKYIPSRTKKEYYQDNKDIIIKKNAEYLKKNNIDRVRS